MTYDKYDPMSAYHSKPKGFGKVVRADAPDNSEWSEQLRFCKWLKHTYPDVLFRSDEQNQGKRSPGMQNIMQIIDPYRSGMPDIMIYHCRKHYCGLAIELKKIGASINTPHGRDQEAMHIRLSDQGWKCVFAWGAEDAKVKFEEYLQQGQKPTVQRNDPFDKNYLPF